MRVGVDDRVRVALLGEEPLPVLRASTWSGSGVLMQFPVDEPWSVWFRFLADGSFDGWYGNLETPKVRWERPDGSRGLDASDRELDVEVRADCTWAWKDEDEFEAKTGRDGFWTQEGQQRIRADGERLIARLERREPPFDGRFTDFRPDPRWVNPVIPTPWDHPHLVEGA